MRLFGGGSFSLKPAAAGAGYNPRQAADPAALWQCGPLHHPLQGV